jgi:hypothetical protein
VSSQREKMLSLLSPQKPASSRAEPRTAEDLWGALVAPPRRVAILTGRSEALRPDV